MKGKRCALLAVIFLAAAAAGACRMPTPTAGDPGPKPALRGRLTYPMRIALPPGAIVTVSLVEQRGKATSAVLLRETSFPAPGQVPIAFELPYDPTGIDPKRHYALRARITDARGGTHWATRRPVPVLTHGHGETVEIPLVPAVATFRNAPPPTHFFECPEEAFALRHEGDGVRLRFGESELFLRETPAASGAKYADGKNLFWQKGDEAFVELEGRPPQRCRSNPQRAVWEDARWNGVDFRAVGNEPGWHMEIREGRESATIDLVAMHGEHYYSFPNARRETGPGPGRLRYTAALGKHRLVVLLEQLECIDTMSGERFESRVEVRLDNDIFRGCGRRLH
ncbi:MAG: YbaY family lipoprotein [Desulfobacterales bacterium]